MERIGGYMLRVRTGKGDAKILLNRHLSPFTAERIFRNLPLPGLVMRTDDVLYISLDAEGRLERPRKAMKSGEVFFSPTTKALVVALGDMQIDLPITALGKVIFGLGVLSSVSTGERITIEGLDA